MLSQGCASLALGYYQALPPGGRRRSGGLWTPSIASAALETDSGDATGVKAALIRIVFQGTDVRCSLRGWSPGQFSRLCAGVTLPASLRLVCALEHFW
jgi:hypothetical protein